jgi:hypothetical protein
VTTRWASLPVLALLALVLAACSSSPSSSTASRSTTTTRGTGTSTSTSTSTSPSSSTSTTVAPTTSTTTTVVRPANCQPAELHMVASMISGGAGTIEMLVTMANTSSATCTMEGYPGIQLLSASGSPIPTTVVRGGGPEYPTPAANAPPAPVSLAPEQSAAFSFSYSDVPVGNETSCPTSARAEVTPPNDTAYAVIPMQIAPCGNGTLHVSPVYIAT